MKIWIRCVCFCLAFWGAERFCHDKTDGFAVQNILSDLAPDPRRATKEPSCFAEIEKILTQPFTYLGSGGQCYAFLSADKKTVIKLFKHHHLKPIFSSSETKREAFFQSCKLSFEELQEETGLIYAHLNKTRHLKRSITLIDKLGIHHSVDLDNLEFVLQKRVSLALRTVKKLVRTSQHEEAEKAVRAIVEMVAMRCEKGVQDRDNGMRRNMGFFEGKAISIDIGSFSRAPGMKQRDEMRQEIKEKTWRLALFLKRQSPSLWEKYNESVEKAVQKRGVLQVSQEPLSLLNQSFYYLGEGGQFLAYLGEDKKTVLKFFLHSRKKGSDLSSLFASTRLAFDALKEETGLIALHLDKTEKLFPKVVIHSKLGMRKVVDLDTAEFLLQQYAEPFCSGLEKKMQWGDVEGAKRQIVSLIHSLRTQCQKGVHNSDTAFKRNFGTIGERAVCIDVGSLWPDERVKKESFAHEEIDKTTARLQRWIKNHYPELLKTYEDAKKDP